MNSTNSMLNQLLAVEGVTDVVINGPNNIWADSGSGMQLVDSAGFGLVTERDVRTLALGLARMARTRLDDAAPVADGELLGGIRLHVVLSPIATTWAGAFISLRKRASKTYSLLELENMGMLTTQQRRKLCKIASSKKNVIISGATGSGKTTLLAAMLREVPENERIIGIEEAPELSNSIHPGLVLMAARKPNSEGTGEVKLSELLKATLRMRPDRIVLGECRGDEVREFLLALGAGYSGSLTTLHADCANSVRNRVETLAYMAGVYTKLAENQFDQYVDAIVHVRRTSTGRKVEEILQVKPAEKVPHALIKEISGK